MIINMQSAIITDDVQIAAVDSEVLLYILSCLQCSDTVGWATGRASGLYVKQSGRVLAWLSLWIERCRLAYGPADATATHCLLLQ